ncbi:hypothetical protein HPB48_000099 [Haemaphysalis longicornis]|uniref:Uncharacterized protein n=1 Tax=Haemaphysalis longicornis TaxID=44386 RepID=A0A9J6GDM8_HAELO|nr:hypothetical protein HPB48_000099 [Haemaphysalis longicornis]
MVPPRPMAPTHSLTARQTPSHGETTAPDNTAAFPSQRGYDPEEMAWSNISHAGDEVSAAAEPIRNENLFPLLNRRRPPPKTLPASSYQSSKLLPHAGKRSSQTSIETKTFFRNLPDDFVHPERLRDRPHSGDFVINSAKGDLPLRGYLKEGDEEVKPRTVLYNSEIITIRPHIRTIPSCGLCGTVGHRVGTCPNPNQDRCGLCGQQAPFVEGMRAPHECNAKCAVCGGGHATNSRVCAAKYRTLTKLDARKGKNKNPAGKPAKRQPAPRRLKKVAVTHHWRDVNLTRAAPSGHAEKQGAAATPPPPHGAKATQAAPSRNKQKGKALSSPHAEIMESKAAAPATLESSIDALETRIENKFADMMSESQERVPV